MRYLLCLCLLLNGCLIDLEPPGMAVMNDQLALLNINLQKLDKDLNNLSSELGGLSALSGQIALLRRELASVNDNIHTLETGELYRIRVMLESLRNEIGYLNLAVTDPALLEFIQQLLLQLEEVT